MQNNHSITARIVYSVDQMAKAKGLLNPYELDALVGVATRALANASTEMEALEAARKEADRIIKSNNAIKDIFEAAHLLQPQALSLA